MKYYKVLNEDGSAFHGGNGKWSLPQDRKYGAWMPEIEGELKPCENGYHLCRKQDLIHWLGPAIFVAEGSGEKIIHENKVVFRKARLIRRITTWDERTQRLFAADCTKHVLHIYEKKYPNDDRPRKAIQAARDYANWKISAAASAAASVAAAAAESASAAASTAAWAAARAAEIKWQTERLFQYLEGN